MAPEPSTLSADLKTEHASPGLAVTRCPVRSSRMSTVDCKNCGSRVPEGTAKCPGCGSSAEASRNASGFGPPKATERVNIPPFVTTAAKVVDAHGADYVRDKAQGAADWVGDAAGSVADKVEGAAGSVAGRVADAADATADAIGWLVRTIKRVGLIVLFPLWFVLMLFGCGPFS